MEPNQIEPVERQPGFERLLDSREAAALLRMHHKTLERWARHERVPGYFYNGKWFFRASELDEWLRSDVHSGSQFVRLNGDSNEIQADALSIRMCGTKKTKERSGRLGLPLAGAADERNHHP